VWVKVPRSYYLKWLDDRDPSKEDLQRLVERTEQSIRTAVRHEGPPDQLGDVEINTIPDELPPPAPPPATPDRRRAGPRWAPAGGGGLAHPRPAGGGFPGGRPPPAGGPAGPPGRPRPLQDRRAPGHRRGTRPVRAGPRADPDQPRGRRQRAPPLDRARRADR